MSRSATITVTLRAKELNYVLWRRGANVQPWSIRHEIGGYELTCSRCHRTQARITTQAQTD
jgi:hypothetical protein